MSKLATRLKSVVLEHTPERGRFSSLEEWSGIPADNWKSFWYGRQRPVAEMIQFASRRWPQYAFWIASGMTDTAHGHTCPPSQTADILEPGFHLTFSAYEYFNVQAKLLDKIQQGKTLNDFDWYEFDQKQRNRKPQVLPANYMVQRIEHDLLKTLETHPQNLAMLNTFIAAYRSLYGNDASIPEYINVPEHADYREKLRYLAYRMGMIELAAKLASFQLNLTVYHANGT